MIFKRNEFSDFRSSYRLFCMRSTDHFFKKYQNLTADCHLISDFYTSICHKNNLTDKNESRKQSVLKFWFNWGNDTYISLKITSKTAVIIDQSSYRKVASSNTSRLEAHAGFCRLLVKGIFDPYVPFDKKLIS